MLSNILFTLAIIWLTFAIASILVGMYYTYTVVLPWLINWDSSEEIPQDYDQSQLTTMWDDNPPIPRGVSGYRDDEGNIFWDDGTMGYCDDDLPF